MGIVECEPNQVKDCLAEINTDRVKFRGMPPPYAFYTSCVKAADHPISSGAIGCPGNHFRPQAP